MLNILVMKGEKKMTKEIERERKKFKIKTGRFARESIEDLSLRGYSKE